MRILQSITYYLPYVSGITIYAHRLGEALTKRGHKIIVATSQYKPNLKQDEEMNGIHIKRAPVLFSVSKGPIMPKWAFTIWRELGKSDIVLIHLPQFEGVITALVAKMHSFLRAKLLKKPVVAVYHCEVTLPEGIVNKLIGLILNFSQWLTCLLADRIVVYTEDYAEHSRILSCFRSKWVQIYPPIKIQELRIKNQELRIKLSDLFVKIGFAGRIAEEKGIEILISAMQQLKVRGSKSKVQGRKIKLIIAGPEPIGEDRYVRKIKNLVKKNKTDVEFLGNLGQSELVDFYKSIDVLVLPSVNSTEAFGLVQVEAMLCGTPVVATNLPGVRVPIQETGMGEIVPPRDSKALAEAIVKVVNNKKLYTKSRDKIMDVFDIDKTITKYKDIFNSLNT